MKKHIFFIALLFICSSAVLAQEPAEEKTISREEGTKVLVDHIAPKLNLNKVKKDSLSIIFSQFMDDIQKYHAENNPKVFSFMVKKRDDNVMNLLKDTLKFSKYLLILEEIKKQPLPMHNSRQPNPQGGRRGRMGSNGMNSGRSY
ncbi:MAG: hypothetical protein WCK34_02350 [Bacteroidota bacterium]